MNASLRITFLEDPKNYFSTIRKKYATSWSRIANNINVSQRTLTSWRLRENTMPSEVAERWTKKFGVALPKHLLVNLDDKRKKAGSLGGKARQLLYGNLGTAEGRRRGGLRSWRTHKKNSTSPFVARSVKAPRRSAYFAELIGAILGDGTVTAYQLVLYSNLFDEAEYSEFLSDLVMRVFRVKTTTREFKRYGVLRLMCSRIRVVEHLKRAGVGIGNKVLRQAQVPPWIRRSKVFTKACLRGLVDTDGCVYLDHHRVRGRDYASLCIAFTNASKPLLDFVFEAWDSLGFHPTRHKKDVRLRRREEVLRYEKEVGFNNPKHTRKIRV